MNLRLNHDQIAAHIHSFHYHVPLPGRRLSLARHLRPHSLSFLKIPTRIAAGGMLYRAGHDAVLDVIGFAGRDMQGTISADGRLLGHFWLVTDDDILIDFSPGDWRAIANDTGAHIVGEELGSCPRPIEWVATPPAYYWEPRSEFQRSAGAGTAPPIDRPSLVHGSVA